MGYLEERRPYIAIQNVRNDPGPLFTKHADVSPQDLAKSQSRNIRGYDFSIALKIDRCMLHFRAK